MDQINPKTGKPVKEDYSDALKRVFQQVNHLINRKYSKGKVLDAFEAIIKELVEQDGVFTNTVDNYAEKILITSEKEEDAFTSLLIAPYRTFAHTTLSTFCHKLSVLIYETGMKDEILEYLFWIVLAEMQKRFTAAIDYYYYIRKATITKVKYGIV